MKMEEKDMQLIEEIVQDDFCQMDENLLYALSSIAHDHMYLVTTTAGSQPDEEVRVCTLCGKTLSSSYCLEKHLQDCHNDNKLYECEICCKCFAKESQLLTHLICHNSLRIYSCVVCQKTFVRQETLKRHMRVHDALKPFQCMFCDRQFKFRTPWKMHEATHSDEQPFECNECGVKFSLGATLKEHQEEGSCTAQTFTCIDCQLEFSRRMDYLLHLNQMHGGKLVQKDYSCTYCNKAFIYRSLLRVHERCHTGEEPYQCHRCGRTFAHRYQLRSHNCTLGLHQDSVSCQFCSYKCTSKRAMGLHQRTHSDNYLFCQFCRKRFTLHSKWSKHIALCQNVSVRLVPCPHCPMTFVSTTAQKIHEGRVHKDYVATPVVCELHQDGHSKPCNLCQVCGKCFSEKSVLNKHYRVHTGERPYQCQFCGNRFTSPSALQNHERTHTGERPHRCTICGKHFAQRTSLVEHIRRHTKDMPHKCSLCNKGFMVPSLLKKHQRTHFKSKV